MSDGSVHCVLGDLGMIFDITPTWARSKLGTVEPGTPEFDYMLATLVFDLVKKNALAHKVLRGFLLHADPEVTRVVLKDIRDQQDMGQDYEALARATEKRMLEVVGEVADDHVQIAELLTRWHGDHDDHGDYGDPGEYGDYGEGPTGEPSGSAG